MLRLARSRLLLRAGASRVAGVWAPRASCLAAVETFCSPRQRHVQASRFFSSQTEDEDKPSLFSAVAWREAVKPAYLTFLKLEKHLMVPVAFNVPHGDDAWPRAAWGYALGEHAKWLRKQRREGGRKINPEQLQDLEEMSFAWDWSQFKWGHFFLPALRRFYELNGHTDVPHTYRVPKGNPKWPEHLWELRLGYKVSNIRIRGAFLKQANADAEELEQLNFCHESTLADRDWHKKLIPALKAFQQEFGHCDVGTAFRVPSSSPWPKAAWGMRQGESVSAIRTRNLGVGRDHRELDDLGFVWNHSEAEWSERILPALKVFRQINGHCRVPQIFAVPSDYSYPERSWGLNLGIAVNSIRRSINAYPAQVSRDRNQLEALGFVWNPTEAEWNGAFFQH